VVKKQAGYALVWVTAVVIAIVVGLAAVSTVGASLRGRGPIGNEVVRNVDRGAEVQVRPDPDATVVSREIRGDYGTFTVACQGVYALGKGARPRSSSGWRVISFEPGPDDDVDAVFSNRRRSVEIEVFCNRGRPTVAEIERNQLPGEDD